MRTFTAVLLLAAFVSTFRSSGQRGISPVKSEVGIGVTIRLPDPSWAVEVKPYPTRWQPPGLANPDVTCDKIFSCANCSYSRVCRPKEDGTLTHYTDLPCPEDNAYCDSTSGTCVNYVPWECGLEDDIICLEKNHFFPNTDCKKYHYCNDRYESKLFQCLGEGTYYNAEEQRCMSLTDSSSCGKFVCDENRFMKTKHSTFPRYFTMCETVKNIAVPRILGHCPPYHQIGEISQVCEPDCVTHGNGTIPDIKDCTKYHTCAEILLADGNVYMQRISKTCPIQYSFDSTLFICVPDPNGKICSKSVSN